MSTVFLNWRTLCGSNDRRFTFSGTELSVAICGPQSRFAVYEMRCQGADGFPDRYYVVRDAGGVSDADLKAGKRPPIIGQTKDYDAVVRFLEKHREGAS